MDRSIRAVLFGTLTLRFSTGLTGGLFLYYMNDLPRHGGPEVSSFLLGLMMATYFVAELILSPGFGVLSDHLGAHRVMQWGPVFGAVAVVLTDWNGWWEVHHSIAASYNASHTLGWVQTNDHFQTSSWFPFPFCGTTDVYDSVNRVYAEPTGYAAGDVTTWQTGACGFLLYYTAYVWLGT